MQRKNPKRVGALYTQSTLRKTHFADARTHTCDEWSTPQHTHYLASVSPKVHRCLPQYFLSFLSNMSENEASWTKSKKLLQRRRKTHVPQLGRPVRTLKQLHCVMAHLDCRRRTRVRTLTQIPVLHRNREYYLHLSLCDVNMFCIVQCSHRVWNLNIESVRESVSINVNEP